MLVSEEWLRTWLNPKQDLATIAYDLTQLGLEVEEISTPAVADLSQFVVAEILTAKQHPNADRLKLCTVTDGTQEYSIVCGAPNARAGIKVVLAPVGTTMPSGMVIKQTKIRGCVSAGMLCAANELELSAAAQGIMELEPAAPLGVSITKVISAPSPTLHLAITPDRGDCLSIQGVARELAAFYKLPLRPPKLPRIKATQTREFPVELEAATACPLYVGRVVQGLDLSKPTPEWLQRRLLDAGYKPLNIAVDVTNYVMHELGQPLHAFDLRNLSGGIKVRYAQPQETLLLLDGTELKLDEEVLLIADHKQPVALAGVMGGLKSGIAADTSEVFLEAAHFKPEQVFSTRQKYKLNTEAAYRFERFVDPDLTVTALERATELLIATAGGSPGPLTRTVATEHLPSQQLLLLKPKAVAAFLGVELSEQTLAKHLTSLGFALTKHGADWQVKPPAFRTGMDCAAALYEEVARLHGYTKFPQTLPHSELRPQLTKPELLRAEATRDFLAGRGFNEVINYSFISPAELQHFYPQTPGLELANPISTELSIMRPGLLASLLKSLVYNQRRQLHYAKLFELGLCFIRDGGALEQQNHLGFVSLRPKVPRLYNYRAYDFGSLITEIKDLLGLWQVSSALQLDYEPAAKSPLFHPKQQLSLVAAGRELGQAGVLHPQLTATAKLDGYEVYYFNCNLDGLPPALKPNYQRFTDLPLAHFELSLLMATSFSYEQLQAAIFACADSRLQQLELLDIYQGETLGAEKKSVTLRLSFQPTTQVLTDDEVNGLVQQLLEALKAKQQIKLRS